jgi:uncharacterized DUF497 family protein
MEWDEKKNKANKKKHGITFEEAKQIFEDPNAIEFYDSKNSTAQEDRFVCIGSIGESLIVVVVFTDRSGVVRIISARKAEPKESEVYYEHFKKKN